MKRMLRRGTVMPYTNQFCDAQAMKGRKAAPATHQTQPEMYLVKERRTVVFVVFVSYRR